MIPASPDSFVYRGADFSPNSFGSPSGSPSFSTQHEFLNVNITENPSTSLPRKNQTKSHQRSTGRQNVLQTAKAPNPMQDHDSTWNSGSGPFVMPNSIPAQADRKCQFIDSTYQFEELCRILQQETSLAVCFKIFADHSYQFVCILQISVLSMDYIIDTINLRSQLFQLEKIFSNPNIVKVVYDENFVVSLLHNLTGLDFVNTYDVFKASRRLTRPTNDVFELGALICNSSVSKNRVMEGADWRYRPLSREMLAYAQQESSILHMIYLTFQADEMTQRTEFKEQTTANDNIIVSLSSWRMKVGQQEQVNHHAVLSDEQIFRIAQLRPSSELELVRTCGSPSRFVMEHAGELIEIINPTRSSTSCPFPSSRDELPTPITELFTNSSWGIGQSKMTTSHSAPATPISRYGSTASVPDSMEEIYQLSNANRKRNKEKKKMKGDNAKLESAFATMEEPDEPSDKVIQNPEEFMRKIGWLGDGNSPKLQLSPKPRSHRRTRSGDGPDKGKPKRRGKRHRKQGSCTFPPKHGGFPFGEHSPHSGGNKNTNQSPSSPGGKSGGKRRPHQTI